MRLESNDRMSESAESGSQILQQWNQMLNSTDKGAVDLALAAAKEDTSAREAAVASIADETVATRERVEAMSPSGIESSMSPEMIGQYEKLCSLDMNQAPSEFSEDYEVIMDRLISLMYDASHPISWGTFAAYIGVQMTWVPFEDRPKDRQLLRGYLISNVDTSLLETSTGVTLTRSPPQVLSAYVLYPIIQYFQNATFGGDGTDWIDDPTYRNTRESHIKYYKENKYALLSLDNDDIATTLYSEDYKTLFKKIDGDKRIPESRKRRTKIIEAEKLYESKLDALREIFKERTAEFVDWNPITNASYETKRESFGDKIRGWVKNALWWRRQDNSCMARLEAIMRHEWSVFGKRVTFQDMIRDETGDGENSDFLGAIRKILWYYVAESILYANSFSVREFRKEQVKKLMKKIWITWFVDTLADEWNLADRESVEDLSTEVLWIEFSGEESAEDAGE